MQKVWALNHSTALVMFGTTIHLHFAAVMIHSLSEKMLGFTFEK